MARRGTRMGRQPLGFRGRGEDKFSSTTLATLPSGVTLDKAGGTFAKGITTGSGCTLKKIDFGQGVQYRVYRGETGVSGAGGPDTRLSGGSIEIDTGLTTISSFAFGWQFQSGVTVGATKRATYAWNNAGFHHSSGNTVMIFLVNNSGGAVTPGCSAGYTGVSVSWIAVGV